MDLSIVVPVYNEEAALPALLQRLDAAVAALAEEEGEGFAAEYLFVDDGSSDGSRALLQHWASQDARIRWVGLSRNFGHQVALAAGLDHARGQAVAVLDADGQDPPELLPALWRSYRQGNQVVYAQRRSRPGDGPLKRATAHLFYRILSRLARVEVPLDTGDFRLLARPVVEALRRMPEQHKFLRGQVAWLGFRQAAVPFDRGNRSGGRSAYGLGRLFRLALDGLTSLTNWPLRLATYLGFLASGVAFVLILYALWSYFIAQSTVPGWTSLMIAVLFLGGAQLISMGIIGEYLARLHDNVRQRPLYVVEDANVAPTPSSPPPSSAPQTPSAASGSWGR